MVTPVPPISHEQISFDYIRHLIGVDARVILEIGAHHGLHTARFLNLFPHAAIYSFEPDPRAITKFKARISDPRAHLYEMAIGATDGEAKFHVSSGLPPGLAPAKAAEVYPQGFDQSGSLRAPKTHKEVWPWCKFEQTITVPVRRLDSWAREHSISMVDFIWADVQGAEGDLINGSRVTLARTRYLFTEYSNDEWYEGQMNLMQLMELLPDYAIVKRFPTDVLLMNLAITNAKNSN